jgi:hypothetical protein
MNDDKTIKITQLREFLSLVQTDERARTFMVTLHDSVNEAHQKLRVKGTRITIRQVTEEYMNTYMHLSKSKYIDEYPGGDIFEKSMNFTISKLKKKEGEEI